MSEWRTDRFRVSYRVRARCPLLGHHFESFHLEPEVIQEGLGPRKKRACSEVSNNMGEVPTFTYAERVQNGGITEGERAYLMHTMATDLRRLECKAGEGKKVMQVSTELSMGKAITGLYKAMSCGLYLYFMGKPPSEDEFKRWFQELYGDKVVLCRFHFAGKGFYQAIVESDLQRELVLSTVVAFKGNIVFTVPWSPSFQPEELLQSQCPVWVEFPSLPYYLWDQIGEIASSLGRVLFTPKPSQQETKASKKACVLWDRKKEIPEILQFKIAEFKLSVEVKFQTFPDACYKCKQQGHFAKDCPGVPGPQHEQNTAPQKEQAGPEKPSTSQAIVPVSKGKAPEDPIQLRGAPAAPNKPPLKDDGWKEVNKKSSANVAKGQKNQVLQDNINRGKSKTSIKKDARSKTRPLATMLEDKENFFCSTINLSDD